MEMRQKSKNQFAFQPRDSTSGNISEGTQNINWKEHEPPYVYCSVIYNNQLIGQPKCPSVDEWIKQL